MCLFSMAQIILLWNTLTFHYMGEKITDEIPSLKGYSTFFGNWLILQLP